MADTDASAPDSSAAAPDSIWNYVDARDLVLGRKATVNLALARMAAGQQTAAASHASDLLDLADAHTQQQQGIKSGQLDPSAGGLTFTAPADPSAAPGTAPTYQLNTPKVDFGSPQEADLYRALVASGVDPDKLNTFQRGRALQGEIQNLTPGAQRVDALNNKDVAPVDLRDNTFFNKYDAGKPLIGTTPIGDAVIAKDKDSAAAERALTNLRGAQTTETNARTGEDQARTSAVRGRVKAKGPDGKVGYFDAMTDDDGTTHYVQAVGPDGQALDATGTSDGESAFQRNTEYQAHVRGITEKEVLDEAHESGVTPTLVRSVEQELIGAPGGRAKYADPETLRQAIKGRVQTYIDIANRRGGAAAAPVNPAAVPAAAAGVSPANPQNDGPPAAYPDARKAPDGNWYVQKDGQYFRVKQ